MKSTLLSAAAATIVLATLSASAQTLTGQAAFTDYSKEHPGVRRKVTVADLPQPYATESANNAAAIAPRPDGVWPQTLPGFKVEQFATGLENPRLMRMAPNGDIFLAESSAGQDHRVSRHGRGRQGRPDGNLRHRPEGRVRDQLLSRAGPIRNGSMWATPTSVVRFPLPESAT